MSNVKVDSDLPTLQVEQHLFKHGVFIGIDFLPVAEKVLNL